jgi:hypothetical protein
VSYTTRKINEEEVEERRRNRKEQRQRTCDKERENTESTPSLASSAPFKPPPYTLSLLSRIRTYIRTQLAIHISKLKRKIHDEKGGKGGNYSMTLQEQRKSILYRYIDGKILNGQIVRDGRERREACVGVVCQSGVPRPFAPRLVSDGRIWVNI